MKTLLALAACAFLAGCAYSPAPQTSTVYIAPDAMRTYHPLPREERQVSTCSMNMGTKSVNCW